MPPVLHQIIVFLNYFVLGYFIVVNSTNLITIVLAFSSLRMYARRLRFYHVTEVLSGAAVPPITLILPAYNEESTCVESVRSMLGLRYPGYEVLVVNDGSEDAMLARLKDVFLLEPSARFPTADLPTSPVRGVYRSRAHPRLWVIDKENGGKSDALNAGINYCSTPLFSGLDADTLLEQDSLVRIVRPFLEDDHTLAAGGSIRIVNGCTVRSGVVTDVRMPRNWLARFQILEYLRAFLHGRLGWDTLDAL